MLAFDIQPPSDKNVLLGTARFAFHLHVLQEVVLFSVSSWSTQRNLALLPYICSCLKTFLNINGRLFFLISCLQASLSSPFSQNILREKISCWEATEIWSSGKHPFPPNKGINKCNVIINLRKKKKRLQKTEQEQRDGTAFKAGFETSKTTVYFLRLYLTENIHTHLPCYISFM